MIKNRWTWIYFYSLASISFFLVVFTGFEVKSIYLKQFKLTYENNFAAWWSGILLLLTSLHAFDGYALSQQAQSGSKRGWAVIALILMILSADEIGSFHERAGNIFPLGSGWLSLLPFAVLLMSLLIYALFSLWKNGESPKRILLIVIGFSLFLTVALQEFLEHRVTWEQWMRPIRGSVEEGTELLGMLILMKVCLPNTQGLFGNRFKNEPTFDLIQSKRQFIKASALIVAPFLIYITAVLPDQNRGHPADWLAAALFLFAALSTAMRFLKYGLKIQPIEVMIVLLCFFASAAVVACEPKHKIDLAFGNPSLRMIVFFLISTGLCLLWILSINFKKKIYLSKAILIGIVASFALFMSNLFVQYGIPVAVGLLVYSVNATQNHLLEGVLSGKHA
jgi:hypothetical protein